MLQIATLGLGIFTHIGGRVPDGLYEEARNESFEKELVDLSWAEAEINAWNRAGHTLVTLGTL